MVTFILCCRLHSLTLSLSTLTIDIEIVGRERERERERKRAIEPHHVGVHVVSAHADEDWNTKWPTQRLCCTIIQPLTKEEEMSTNTTLVSVTFPWCLCCRFFLWFFTVSDPWSVNCIVSIDAIAIFVIDILSHNILFTHSCSDNSLSILAAFLVSTGDMQSYVMPHNCWFPLSYA